MRIAYFVDTFPLISETFVFEQITGMIDRGHDVTIFANKLCSTDVRHPVVDDYGLMDRVVVRPKVDRGLVRRVYQAAAALVSLAQEGSLSRSLGALDIRRFGKQALGLSLLVRASSYYRYAPFDVLHCQFGQLAGGVARLRECGALQGVLVTSFRGADISRYARLNPTGFAMVFNLGDAFLAVSESVRRQLLELGCPQDRVHVLRSGINLDRFDFRGFRPPHDPLRLLTVARLAPKKGIEFGLRAVRNLVTGGRNVHYRIIGDGPLRDDLCTLAESLRVSEVVSFEGAVSSDKVVGFLYESDLLLAPSVRGPDGDEEGIPNSLKEAMATGVPCVGTDSGGTPELIRDGWNGFLVGQGDETAIETCVVDAMDHWGRLAPVVKNARRTIEKEYDISALNDELESTYAKLVEAA